MKQAQGQGDGDQTQGTGSEWGRAGQAPTAPAPPALTSEDAGAELFWFSLSLYPLPSPPNPASLGNVFIRGLFFFCFSFFFSVSTSGNFCILFSLKRKKKISLNETKPKEPIFDLGSLAGR